jgi:hypothetical protein
MSQLVIKNISGTPPFQVYVSDQYVNNKTLIATISDSVPPQQFFFLPSLFNGIDKILVEIIDSSGCDHCSFLKLIECRFGCSFNVIIQELGCSVTLKIDKTTCEINKVSII